MNTKNKSLKENFGYLFENTEDFGMSEEDLDTRSVTSYKKSTLTIEKDFMEVFQNPKDEASALAVLLIVEFICAKTSNREKSILNSLDNQTLSTLVTTIQSQRANYIKMFDELLQNNQQSKLLFFAYSNAIKLLTEVGIGKIILSEANITLRKQVLQQKLDQALRQIGDSTSINLQKFYNYFLDQLDSIATMPKSKESGSDKKLEVKDFAQFKDGRLNLIATAIYIENHPKLSDPTFINRLTDISSDKEGKIISDDYKAFSDLRDDFIDFLQQRKLDFSRLDQDILTLLLGAGTETGSLEGQFVVTENKKFKISGGQIDELSMQIGETSDLLAICKKVYEFNNTSNLLTAVEGDAEEAGEEAGDTAGEESSLPPMRERTFIKIFKKLKDDNIKVKSKAEEVNGVICTLTSPVQVEFQDKFNTQNLSIEEVIFSQSTTPNSLRLHATVSDSDKPLTAPYEIEEIATAIINKHIPSLLASKIQEAFPEIGSLVEKLVPSERKKELEAATETLSKEEQEAGEKKLEEVQAENEKEEAVNKDTAETLEALLQSDLVKRLDERIYNNGLSRAIKQAFKPGFDGFNEEGDESNTIDFDKIRSGDASECDKLANSLEGDLKPDASDLKSMISNVYDKELAKIWDGVFKNNFNEDVFKYGYTSTITRAYDYYIKGSKSLTESNWWGDKGLKALGIVSGGYLAYVGLMALAAMGTAAAPFVLGISGLSLTASLYKISQYKKAQRAYKDDPIKYLEENLFKGDSLDHMNNLIRKLTIDSILSKLNPRYKGLDFKCDAIKQTVENNRSNIKAQETKFNSLSNDQKKIAKQRLNAIKQNFDNVPYSYQHGLFNSQTINIVYDEFLLGDNLSEELRNKLLSNEKQSYSDGEINEMIEAAEAAIKKTGTDNKFIGWINQYNKDRNRLRFGKDYWKDLKTHIKPDASKPMFKFWGEEWGWQILQNMSQVNKEYYDIMILELTGRKFGSLEGTNKELYDKKTTAESYYRRSLASLLFENQGEEDLSDDWFQSDEESQSSEESQGGQQQGLQGEQERQSGEEEEDTQAAAASGEGSEDDARATGLARGTIAGIAAYLLPYLEYQSNFRTVIQKVFTLGYAPNPAAAKSYQLGKMIASGVKQDPIHSIIFNPIKNKLEVFYYYSEQALAGTKDALSGISVDLNTGVASMRGHAKYFAEWTKKAAQYDFSAGAGKGSIVDIKNGVVQISAAGKAAGCQVVSYGDPQFYQALGAIKNTLRGALTVQQKAEVTLQMSSFLGAKQVGWMSITDIDGFKNMYNSMVDIMQKLDPSISQQDAITQTATYFKGIMSKVGFKVEFSNVVDKDTLFAVLDGFDVSKIKATVKAIFKLVGSDAQHGQHLDLIQRTINKTMRVAAKDLVNVNWLALTAKCVGYSASAAALYRAAESRNVPGAVAARNVHEILNVNTLVATDFVRAATGEQICDESARELPNPQIQGEPTLQEMESNGGVNSGFESPQEPGFGEEPLLSANNRTPEPSLEAPSESGEERPSSGEGQFREAYHRLRMSDFLFEGVKTRNVVSKNKDSIKLAHQRLQSQFRNMFK